MPTTTLGQAVRNAIEVERAAERFYDLLAESTASDSAQKFLRKMATQEREHATAIEQFGQKMAAGELPTRADDNVEVIETAPDWAFVDNISLKESIHMALECEHHAYLYYEALSGAHSGEVAEFFSEIAELEKQHIRVIEDLLKKGL